MLLSIVYLSSCLSLVYSLFPSYVPFIKVLSSLETKPRWNKDNHSCMDHGKGMRSKLQEVALPEVVLLRALGSISAFLFVDLSGCSSLEAAAACKGYLHL
jgi:hypothetical protein